MVMSDFTINCHFEFVIDIVANFIWFFFFHEKVDGLIRLMEGEHTGPINIGNPGEFTMVELAETVKEVSCC